MPALRCRWKPHISIAYIHVYGSALGELCVKECDEPRMSLARLALIKSCIIKYCCQMVGMMNVVLGYPNAKRIVALGKGLILL